MQDSPKLILEHREAHSIPFHNVMDALNAMRYGSMERIGFQLLFFTGCRVSELDNMKPSQIFPKANRNAEIRWKLGKNQKAWRHEEIPMDLVKEIEYYRRNSRTIAGRLLGVNSTAFRRKFNMAIRPTLGPDWNKKVISEHQEGAIQMEYGLQLKGLRKNFATREFWSEYKQWDDAGIAIEFASKRLRHSSKHMTAMHYIENFKGLDLEKYGHLSMLQIAAGALSQRRLPEFGIYPPV